MSSNNTQRSTRTYFLMAIFNTLIDKKENERIFVARVLEGSLFLSFSVIDSDVV